ncbi:MAG: RHS repeat-associated core domain-containing protein [Fimbriimonadaceae bacterium]
MAGEGGRRPYWPVRQNVNLSNGNLHLEIGSTTCVTCGGGASQGAYPSPDDTKLHGPLLIYNGLGTPDTDLGPKWMLPYHAKITTNVGNGDATLIDADGTERIYTKDASPQTPPQVTVRTLGAKQWDYAYLDNSALDTVTNPDSEVTDHQWLDDGRIKKIVLANGCTRELFYQDTNDSHAYVAGKNTHLRKTLDKKADGTVICSFAYDLDAAGNRLGVTDKDGKYTSYGLDPEYQLKSETKWSAKTATATREFQYGYAYDPNGNRIKLFDDGVLTTSTFGDNNEQLTFGATNLTYDHFGNTTAIGSDAFTWNSEGNMLTGTRGSSVDTHEYNGDGQRMRSKLNNASDWTNFINDPLGTAYPAILAEYTLISGTFTIKSVNTHGFGLINTNREGTKRYFHFDGLGSTWALTDSSQVVQDTYIWSAFGIREASSGSSVNPFRYVGQFGYYDDGAEGSQLGLHFLGLRYYTSGLGKFVSWDSIYSNLNLYQYVHGSPTDLLDPWGERQAQGGLIALGPGGVIAAGVITIGAWIWWLVKDNPITIDLPSPEPAPWAGPKRKPVPRRRPTPEPTPTPIDWDEAWRRYERCEAFCDKRTKIWGWRWNVCCRDWCNWAANNERRGFDIPPWECGGRRPPWG